MFRYFFLLVSLTFFLGLSTADAYTVVLKNGKVIKGTLVSETETILILKGEDGIHYSLKKANLDLEKMREENKPKVVEPPPPPAEEAAPKPKKKARVYTKEDADALKEKYGDLSIGEPIENVEDFEGGVLKPEAYLQYLKDGAARINETLLGMAILRDGTATAWEVAASTGVDPDEAVNNYLTGPAATMNIQRTNQEITSLNSLEDTLSPVPPQFQEGYEAFQAALTGLKSYLSTIRAGNESYDNVNLFRSHLSEVENQVRNQVRRVQMFEPPQPAAKKSVRQPAAETPVEEPAVEEPAVEEPPSVDESTPAEEESTSVEPPAQEESEETPPIN